MEENKLPQFLIDMLNNQYGEKKAKEIISGYCEKRVVSFRVNKLKSNAEEIEKFLKQNNIVFSKPNFSKDAFIVDNISEEKIQELNIYKEGKIYLQSLSSMLPPIVLEPQEGEDILDMAAAPGGKTTQIASITNNKANITACEMNKIRAEKLKYNIEMQGATRVFTMIKDARQIEDFFSFDRILLDAPCSGSGTLSISDKKIEKYFTEVLIQKSAKTQLALLRKAINILKPGKEMVYSTCSILDVENENIVNELLKTGKIEIVPINLEGMEEIQVLPTKIPGTLCVCPNKFYEGFFVAKLRKKQK